MLKGSNIPQGVLNYMENSMSWQAKHSVTQFSYHYIHFTGLGKWILLLVLPNSIKTRLGIAQTTNQSLDFIVAQGENRKITDIFLALKLH